MSTTDKKKGFSSPQHLIKEHHDERTDNTNRETRNAIEVPIEEVHSANDWEHAELGDEQRKQKFLRLMGAKKRKDESGIDTNDSHRTNHNDGQLSEKKHCRSKIENETINRELEKQFNEGLQSKLLDTHHEGLGFHGHEFSPTTTPNHKHQQEFIPATTVIGSSNEPVTNEDQSKS